MKGGNPGNMRSENKVRGNPKQLLEKYKNQAREAKQAGDRVMAEYYYQFADHYQRVLNDMRGPGESWSDDDDANDIDVDGNTGGSDDQQDQGAASDNDQSDDDNNQPQRNRRSRGGRRGGRGNQNNGGDGQQRNDMANQEQPTEVHPELDLQGTPAPEGEQKPRRTRSASPRRSPRVRKDADAGEAPAAAEAPAPQDGEAA